MSKKSRQPKKAEKQNWLNIIVAALMLTLGLMGLLWAKVEGAVSSPTLPPQTQATRVNVALSSNGSVASASSLYSGVGYSFTPGAAINGDRIGLPTSSNMWHDAAPGNTFPDWLQVDFNGVKVIDEVDVFSLQDAYAGAVEPTPTMTASLYVLTAFQVQYWNESAWLDVPGGNLTGNNLVWRKLTFSPITTNKIRVLISGAGDGWSRIVEVEAWGKEAPPRANVALASNGGVASASSIYNASCPASAANNGDRRGVTYWNDSSPSNTFPDWLQVDFDGAKTIDEVDVFSIQDNWSNPSEPTEAMTFNYWGLTAFEVQYWNGSAWASVPGGSVTGNNLVWRKFTFSPLTTTKIRVLTVASPSGYSVLAEVEAWGTNVEAQAYNSLSLNGVDAYVDVTTGPTLDITGPMTAEAWIKTNLLIRQGIIERRGPNDHGYFLRLHDTGQLMFGLSQGETSNDYVLSPSAITTGLWHHVAGIYDGGQIRLYLDGILVASKATSFTPGAGAGILRIGADRLSGGHKFNGLIDEARVTARARYGDNFTPLLHLTAGGVFETADAGGADPAGTRGVWNFDGQLVRDSSGNNNHGSIIGGVSFSPDTPTYQTSDQNSGENATTSQNVQINFERFPDGNYIPTGAPISNQFQGVIFSSESNIFYPPRVSSYCGFCVYSSPPNAVTAGPTQGNYDLILDFTQPVNNLKFYYSGVDIFNGVVAQMDIYQDGSPSAKPVNLGGYRTTGYFFADLSAYPKIKKLRIHVTDPYGLGFDDFSFTPAAGKVESVSFEQIDSPIDTNPNVSGGLSASDNRRIFPDKHSPTDAVNRRRVRVRANTSLGANKIVYFRAFDVDDPSSDASPVDTNGTAGGDNKGAPATSDGGLSALSAQTDSNGVAAVEFMTSMQPGDNFRVAASADQSYINGLLVSGINIRDSAGVALPTDKGKVSPMLTVWRNLHIELDSMGLVTGNRVTGTILRFDRIPNMSGPAIHVNVTLDRTINTNYGDVFDNQSRFQPGRFIANGQWFAIERIYPGPTNTIQITTPNLENIPTGSSFIIVDDDDFNFNDGWNYDGDDNENVARPDTSRLQASDDPNLNVFAPAYVRPKYDIGDNNDFVSFVLNSPSESASGLISTYDFDAVGTEADTNFWTVYLLGAYQCDAEGDVDPSTEQGTSKVAIAVTDAFNGQGSSIFFEMFAEYNSFLSDTFNPASTAGHEIGHLFNGDHLDGGLMAVWSSGARTNYFSPITLNRIRSIPHP